MKNRRPQPTVNAERFWRSSLFSKIAKIAGGLIFTYFFSFFAPKRLNRLSILILTLVVFGITTPARLLFADSATYTATEDSTEKTDGWWATSIASTSWTFGNNYKPGANFTVNIPKDSTITSAYIKLTAQYNDSDNPVCTWKAFNTGNAPAIRCANTCGYNSADQYQFSNPSTGETFTSATVPWTVPDISSGVCLDGIDQTDGLTCSTVDISSIVQEVVNHASWAEGNRMTLMCFYTSGTGDSKFASLDHATLAPPQLVVDWTPASSNEAPTIAISSLVQRTDGSGHIDISFTGTDADDDTATMVSADTEYSISPYDTWNDITFDTADGAHTADEPMSFTSGGASFVSVIDASGWTSGTYEVRFKANDGTDDSTQVTSSEFTVDNTAPTLSSITISDNSGYTNDSTPSISISSSGSPSDVAFSCNGGTNYSSWISYGSTITSFDMTTGATGCNTDQGSKTITAKLKDSAGNESGTAADSTTYDTQAPSAPSTPDLAAADDTGYLDSDNITSSATGLTFSGTAEADSSVQLYKDGVALGDPVTATGGNWTVDNQSLSAGSTYAITAKATDGSGNVSTASSALNVTIDTAAPAISSLSSTTAAGSYNAGDSINITATFSENVTMVGGNLVITLETGDADQTAIDTSITDTDTASATYTVQAGDISSDLTVKTVALSAGFIKDAAGNDASLSIPGGNNLADNEAIVIDTTAPTISSAAVAGNNAYIDVTMGEGIYTGSDGTGAVTTADFSISFAANSGDATDATIASVKNTSDGNLSGGESVIRVNLSITGTPSGVETVTITPASGTAIYDLAGNAMAAGQTTTAKTLNDQAVPTISSITSTTDNGSYNAGDIVNVTINFSENVTLAGGNLVITLETGDTDRTATIDTISGTNTASGTYTVQAGDISSDLTANNVALSAGTLQDAAGNNTTLSIPSGSNIADAKAIVVDTAAPTNQDTVFAASASIQGGGSVTIVSSGDATNAVWFAPSGTTSFSAGATMTTAGGTATSILAPATEGDYKLFVIDAAGNYSSASTATLTVDNSGPAVTGLSNDSSPTTSKTWTWGCSEASCTYRYTIDQIADTAPEGAYGSTTTDSQATGTGTYYIHVQAKDAVGNEGSATHVSAVLDNTAPSGTSISINEGANTISVNINLTIAATGADYMYIDGDVVDNAVTKEWIAYAISAAPALSAGDGLKTVTIKFKDEAGNETGVISDTITLDTAIPAAPTPSVAAGTYSSAQSVTLTAEEGSTIYYTLDGSTPTNGSTQYSSAISVDAGDGVTIVLGARAYDVAGNAGLVLTANYIFDKAAPVAVISGTPSSPANSTSATLTVGGDGVTHYKYKLDAGTYSESEIAIASAISLSDLSESSHTVYVIGRDEVGNWQAEGSATTATWTIDISGPSSPIVTGITPTNDTTPTWSWTANGGGNGTFRYKLDSSDLSSGATETTSTSYTPAEALVGATHTLYVQERDAAGNWSSSGSKVIEIDTTIPEVTGLSDDETPKGSKTWTWGCSEDECTYRFVIDKIAGTVPTGEFTSTATASKSGVTGIYYIHVQAEDEAGNQSTTVTVTAILDSTAPTATLSGTPDTGTTATSISIIVGGDDVTHYKYRIDQQAWSTERLVSAHIEASGLAVGGHTLYVIGRDSVGNWQSVDAATTFSWDISSGNAAPVLTTNSMPPADSNNIICSPLRSEDGVRNMVMIGVSAHDDDGDIVTITMTNKPVNAIFRSESGYGKIFSWPLVATGTTSLTFTAADPEGLTDTETFTVIVVNAGSSCEEAIDDYEESQDGGGDVDETFETSGKPVARVCFGDLTETDGICVTTRIARSGSTVKLDGRGSYQPTTSDLGSAGQSSEDLIYHWTQVAGPAVDLSDNDSADAVQPSFTVPDVENDRLIQCRFDLLVENEFGISDASARATIKVVSNVDDEDAEFVPFAVMGQTSDGIVIQGLASVDSDSSETVNSIFMASSTRTSSSSSGILLTVVNSNGTITRLQDFDNVNEVFSILLPGSETSARSFDITLTEANTGEDGAKQYVISYPEYESGTGAIFKFDYDDVETLTARYGNDIVIDPVNDTDISIDRLYGEEEGSKFGSGVMFVDYDQDGVTDILSKKYNPTTSMASLVGFSGGSYMGRHITMDDSSFDFMIEASEGTDVSDITITSTASATTYSDFGITEGPKIFVSFLGAQGETMMIDYDRDIRGAAGSTFSASDIYQNIHEEGRSYTASGFSSLGAFYMEGLLYNDENDSNTSIIKHYCVAGYLPPAGFEQDYCDEESFGTRIGDYYDKDKFIPLHKSSLYNEAVVEGGSDAKAGMSILKAVVDGEDVDSSESTNVGMGDINNDGYEDTVVGAPASGKVYVYYGTAGFTGAKDTTSADVTITCMSAADQCGRSIKIGDLSGDGYDDIIIGAPSADGQYEELPNAGEVYIIYGQPALDAVIDVVTYEGENIVYGTTEGGYLGLDLVVVDANNNGVYELACNLRTGGAVIISFDVLETLGRTLDVDQIGLAANEYTDPERIVMMVLGLEASTDEDLIVNEITLTASGSGLDNSQIKSVYLFEDVDADGELGNNDRQITDAGIYAADNGTLTFNSIGEVVSAGESAQWLVVYDFENSPSSGLSISRQRPSNPWAIQLAMIAFVIIILLLLSHRKAAMIFISTIMVAAMFLCVGGCGDDSYFMARGEKDATYTFSASIAESDHIKAVGYDSSESADIVGGAVAGSEVSVTFSGDGNYSDEVNSSTAGGCGAFTDTSKK